MRQRLVRFLLLNKRLFKKFSFLMILCLVPALVAGIRMGTREEGGMVSIALCLCDEEDELSADIVEKLMEDEDVLHYIRCGSEGEARKMVENYAADAAWIFPADFREAVEEAAHGKNVSPVVKVVEREDNIALVFTREVLSSAIYPCYSYEVYKDFVRDDCGLTEVAEEKFREEYEKTLIEGSLFQMVYLDGQHSEQKNYLLAPVRGIMAVWLVLCGFAAAMYFMQDEQAGIFAGMPLRHRWGLAVTMQGVLLADGIVVLLAACGLAGVFTTFDREILSAVLFAADIAVFCNLIRILSGRMEYLGSSIPLCLVIMLVLCPVFVNIGGWQPVKCLLPPYYYLKSIHNTSYIWKMACYAAVGTILCILLQRCGKIKRRL